MGKRKVSLFFLIPFSLCVILGAAWTTKRVTNNAGQSVFPAFAVNGQNAYVAYFEGTNEDYEVYFRRSTDGGATWQAAQKLSNNSGWDEGEQLDLAINGANVYVAWCDGSPGNAEIFFRRSIDSGATWKEVKRITTNDGPSTAPAVAASGANVYLVWTQGFIGEDPEIFFRKSVDNGATWQAAKRLTTNTGTSREPAVAVSGANVYVAWEDNSVGNDEIYVRKSTDSGATWQNAKRLTNNTGSSSQPALAVMNANVYVAWNDGTPGNSEIYFRRSEDGGATWKAAKRFTYTADETLYVDLAVSGANVYAVWHDRTPGNYDLYFKKSADNGATWAATQRLTSNAGDQGLPDLGVNATKVFVAYVDEAPGNYEIYLKYSPL